MGLLFFFQRNGDGKLAGAARKTAASNDATTDSVQLARIRARQRLMGATVLVVIGIIVFPLIFETQPRPIAVDIPIEIPRKENPTPLAMPPSRPVPPVTPAAAEEIVTETRAEAGSEPRLAKSEAVQAEAPSQPAAAASTPAVKRPPSVAPPAQPSAADGARAQALLEDKPSAAASSPRYVVQVGAFADAAAARDMRAKVERLGIKTYTQVTDTSSGARTRVRVGPVTSREEADKVQARIRAAGLPAVVLTL